MEAENHTVLSQFLLLGLSDDPKLQPVLFGIFLSMYLVTVLGNLLIILATTSDPHLHTPMYFFLSNLSLADICFISTTVPKMLVNIQTHSHDISYTECLTQVYFFLMFLGVDNFLLTAMACDRFVAICHPLNYTVIMNPRLCVLLVLTSWLIMFWVSLIHVLLTKQLTFSTVNHTCVSQFLLLGLSDDPELQPVLFGLFLSMYLVTVLGNLLIILAVSSDSHLHTPMYFFLSNLSFVDICFISTTVPKMLVNIQVQRKDISYIECFTQVYFLIIFIGMDNFLLSVMAFDRFVAICHPLNYTVIMNPRLCVLLVLLCWLIMFWVSLIHILLVKRLTFSVGTEIPHFFCELTQLLDVASSDTHVNYVVMHVLSALLGVIPMTGILYSYSQIISSLLKMSSIVNKYKAFSTCGSHLCVVSLFYGTAFGVYLSSAVTHASQRRLITSVMYSVITPMLNPFIYSLRNKDVKGTLGRLLSRASSGL
nr:olfactory receptor 7D4-like [Marmota flaviventris]